MGPCCSQWWKPSTLARAAICGNNNAGDGTAAGWLAQVCLCGCVHCVSGSKPRCACTDRAEVCCSVGANAVLRCGAQRWGCTQSCSRRKQGCQLTGMWRTSGMAAAVALATASTNAGSRPSCMRASAAGSPASSPADSCCTYWRVSDSASSPAHACSSRASAGCCHCRRPWTAAARVQALTACCWGLVQLQWLPGPGAVVEGLSAGACVAGMAPHVRLLVQVCPTKTTLLARNLSAGREWDCRDAGHYYLRIAGAGTIRIQHTAADLRSFLLRAGLCDRCVTYGTAVSLCAK